MVTLGVPSDVSTRLGRSPRSFERRPDDVIFYVEPGLLVDSCEEMVLPAHIREAWQPIIDARRV